VNDGDVHGSYGDVDEGDYHTPSSEGYVDVFVEHYDADVDEPDWHADDFVSDASGLPQLLMRNVENDVESVMSVFDDEQHVAFSPVYSVSVHLISSAFGAD